MARKKPEAPPKKTRASKRAAEDDEAEEVKNKPAPSKATGWGFLKAPSGVQLKKQKKAGKPTDSDDVEFPPLSEADLALFNDEIPTKTTDDGLRIIAWNVNGIRAVLKKDNYFRAYIAREDPDILCLSEIKIDDTALASVKRILPQYAFQHWKCADQKGYSGTAVFSKVKPLSVQTSLVVDGEEENEGRYIALEFNRFWLVHTYVPNAGQKLERLSYRTEQWDTTLQATLKELEKTKPVIWCGDLNVAHEEIDIHDPKGNRNKSAGFTDAERESFGSLLKMGFVDTFRKLHPEEQSYTYFSYRFGARGKNKGWRLDYFVVSESLMPNVEESYIRSTITGSDHLPIGVSIKDICD
ncbi:Aste57867_17302 [Aphanomyces stellatus]|uniref:DNA-(apurinic or apyrimidinic site) endonuclease n=1 Tax=Aphanomyces stellatus TaxID=120398 RepID=A0A485L958_9STRA|nr:hypothetical protein As57867_017243 [Aphanomyces stellatus]KAF0713648.1 hypothetical protein As57867_004259 [Aphanomyces stellatus]VFT81385.1 Aste57867_4270 [Aphanomyces stellatus]VFT94058.1 Aste57867_17302 [Aphanomyces stellatus]